MTPRQFFGMPYAHAVKLHNELKDIPSYIELLKREGFNDN